MLARQPLRQLYLAVCVVFAAPILLLAWLFYSSEQENIAFSKTELVGVAYLNALWPSMASIARGVPADIAQLTEAGDANNSSLNSWQQWRDYRMALEGGADTATTLAAGISLIRAVGDGSRLILDPELDSYYLMDAAVLRLPVVLSEIALLNEYAEETLRLPRDGDAYFRLISQATELSRDTQAVHYAFDSAFRSNRDGGVSRDLASPFLTARLAMFELNEAVKAMTQRGISVAQAERRLIALSAARTNAVNAIDALYGQTLKQLERLLRNRVEMISQGLWTNLSISGIVAILAIILAVVFASRISKVLTDLAQRLHALSRGDVGIDIPYTTYCNEIGLIARSLSVFRDHALDRLALAEQIASAHIERERDLERVAYYDDLTGLPNRKHLYRGFGAFLAQHGDQARGAVIYLDLDRFKEINDTLGHVVGDSLIRIAAERLTALSRPNDIIARISGDEFAMLLADIDDAEIVAHFAARLLQRLSEPYEIEGAVQHLTASIGIALIAPKLAHEPEELLRRADVALYRAKERGRNCYVLFDSVFDADVLYRKRIESALREAIESNQVRLAFQPQFCTQGQTVVGVEALARWEDPKLGTISPAVFIPVAEHTGLIVELGRSILRQAMDHAKRWPDLTVAVNISVLQLRQKGFIEMLAAAAMDAGIAPGRIELELTESILLEDVDEVNDKLRQVKALGYRLALDDFGTGYSSLSYLTRFEFDKLKIDRSFVQNLEGSPHARTVMRSIAALGRAVGLEVCAEGVETEAQLEVVREVGCTSVQGYLFMPAVPAAEIDALAERRERQTFQSEVRRRIS